MSRSLVLGLLLGFSVALALFKKEKSGSFLGLPYSVEWPTPSRIRRSLWDPQDPRLLTPRVFGWGYSLNLHAVAKRLGLV